MPTRKGNRGNTAVELDGNRYPVRRTPKRGLRQVDFTFEGNEIRGLEQNPDTRSLWAKLARSGKVQHYTVADIANAWKLSEDTIRKPFRGEPTLLNEASPSRQDIAP